MCSLFFLQLVYLRLINKLLGFSPVVLNIVVSDVHVMLSCMSFRFVYKHATKTLLYIMLFSDSFVCCVKTNITNVSLMCH